MTDELDDDDLGNVTASPEDVAYECGWHDGVDYGYRLARRELGLPDDEVPDRPIRARPTRRRR